MIEWLTTIPGILILCGVLLLIIAIILFIVGAKKSKNEEVVNNSQVVSNNLNTVNSQVNVGGVTPTVNENIVPNMVPPVTTVSQAEPVNIVSGVETAPVVEPQVVPVQSIELNNQEVVASIPVVEEQQPVDMEKTQVIDTAAIYGGEMPKVDFNVQTEKPVTIYGGNDPLEATQTFPAMEENHVPYGGNLNDVKVVDTAMETINPMPVEEPVAAMPIIEPVIETVTEVVNEPVVEEIASIPAVEPVVEIPVVQPTEEPVNTSVQEPVIISEPEVVTIPTNEVSVAETSSNVEEL